VTAPAAAVLAPPVTPAGLDLDARLAAVDAEMTVRLEQASLRHAVDATTAETVVDWASDAPAPAPVDLYPTPVAALLLRARARIVAGGWSQDAARTSGGGMCLAELIRAEAHTHAEEGEARLLLRRALGGGDPISEHNRRLGGSTAAAQVLANAAAMATQQGL